MHDVKGDEVGFADKDLKAFWELFGKQPDFDSKGFIELCRDTDENTVLQILARFVENLENCHRAIAEALKADDCDKAWKALHKVAGSAELLGFGIYGERARQLSFEIRAKLQLTAYQEELEQYLNETEWLKVRISSNCQSLNQHLV